MIICICGAYEQLIEHLWSDDGRTHIVTHSNSTYRLGPSGRMGRGKILQPTRTNSMSSALKGVEAKRSCSSKTILYCKIAFNICMMRPFGCLQKICKCFVNAEGCQDISICEKTFAFLKKAKCQRQPPSQCLECTRHQYLDLNSSKGVQQQTYFRLFNIFIWNGQPGHADPDELNTIVGGMNVHTSN